ncbi:hypothetical protein MVEN_01828700 [Mycena venus]|uniref:Uncharacterized protein n=1 Tax=Mycena venus TaxID=2733690 RepID=A0A8H6XL11_9AGAR|nr:hypothetical protein MVEN_01828700 [Mycena venus]
MRPFPILIFLATTLFHQTYSTAIKKRTQAHCDGAVITDTFSIGDALVTLSTCPRRIKSKSMILAKASSVPRSDVELQVRQEDYCNSSLEAIGVQCVNSEPCTYIGADDENSVIKADCDFLTATLENTPDSVLVPFQGTTGVTYQTCEFILFNLASTPIQYSYWNLASVASSTYTNTYKNFGISTGECLAHSYGIDVAFSNNS